MKVYMGQFCLPQVGYFFIKILPIAALRHTDSCILWTLFSGSPRRGLSRWLVIESGIHDRILLFFLSFLLSFSFPFAHAIDLLDVSWGRRLIGSQGWCACLGRSLTWRVIIDPFSSAGQGMLGNGASSYGRRDTDECWLLKHGNCHVLQTKIHILVLKNRRRNWLNRLFFFKNLLCCVLPGFRFLSLSWISLHDGHIEASKASKILLFSESWLWICTVWYMYSHYTVA